MFSTVMVPVDLTHAGQLAKALSMAATLAGQNGARVVYVAVGSNAPSSLGHTPKEFAARLDAFAAEQAAAHGIDAAGHAVISHDPAVELEHALMQAIDDTGADLVVMASHIPTLADHLWPSNGGRIAGHAKVSVLVVRD